MPPSKPKVRSVSMLKYLFKIETLIATCLVFIIIGLLSLIPLNMHFFDPKEIGAKDFDYSDLPYNLLSKYKNVPVDTGIVIVNIGNSDRKGIANILNKVISFHPKVIGTDILFDHPKKGIADSLLKNIFKAHPEIILGWQVTPDKLVTNYFAGERNATGYVNFALENQNVIRDFSPFVTINGKEYLSFDAAIIKQADKNKFEELANRKNETEIINYTRAEDKFIVLNGTDSTKDFSILKNKIVLMGYVSPQYNIEDKHFTPLNPKFTGKGVPDLNGVFIHANIISMAMDDNYVHRTSALFNWCLAFVLCWLHMAFFISYYIEKHIWFHLAVKTLQLISAVVFIYLGLLLFYKFNVQIDMAATLVAIILAVDILYFYEAGVVWLHHKKGYKTIFHHESSH
ncbi:hypothetical protein BH09BAC6_BH09BAC6_19860 [soil metagenome]|jgi:CHASE2 domain-containing sensor protein